MDSTPNGSALAGLFFLIFVLSLIFIPVLIGLAKDRTWLCIAAFVLTLLSCICYAFGPGGIGGIASVSLATNVWTAALLCGLAAFLDRSAELRQKEMLWRMLKNDDSNLPVPWWSRTKNPLQP